MPHIQTSNLETELHILASPALSIHSHTTYSSTVATCSCTTVVFVTLATLLCHVIATSSPAFLQPYWHRPDLSAYKKHFRIPLSIRWRSQPAGTLPPQPQRRRSRSSSRTAQFPLPMPMCMPGGADRVDRHGCWAAARSGRDSAAELHGGPRGGGNASNEKAPRTTTSWRAGMRCRLHGGNIQAPVVLRSVSVARRIENVFKTYFGQCELGVSKMYSNTF